MKSFDQWKSDRIKQLEHHNEQAAARIWQAVERITKLEADLLECREYLEGQMDVVDGSYGQPEPNKAMQLVNMIDERIHGAGNF